MYHVYHLSIEKKGKDLHECPKACLKIVTKLLLQVIYRMSNVTENIQFSGEVKNVTFTKWLQLKKRLWDSLKYATL